MKKSYAILAALWLMFQSPRAMGSVFAVDPTPPSTIVDFAISGDALRTVPTPEPASGLADGLAHSGSSLFFVNGFGFFDGFSGDIFELDPATGAKLGSFPAPVLIGIDALAFSGEFLFALDPATGTIFKINPTTGLVISSCAIPAELLAAGGLAGGHGRLFVTAGFFTSIVELDPATCAVIGELPPPPDPFPAFPFLLGLAFDGLNLFAADAATGTIFKLDPATGVVLSSFSAGFLPSALASSGVRFAHFSVGAETEDDEFEVKGTFTLSTDSDGEESDGINPLAEYTSLQVGTFYTTIPAGSFEQDKKGQFKFEGDINGVALEMKIEALGGGIFEFKAEGEGADLKAENSVTVGLDIGNDSGRTIVTAEFEDEDEEDED